MTIIRIELYQDSNGKPFEHPDRVGRDYTIKRTKSELKFTNRAATNFFCDLLADSKSYFSGRRSFLISKPIKMDVFIDGDFLESFCQLKVTKNKPLKYNSNHQFTFNKQDYFLIPWNDNFTNTTRKRIDKVIPEKESYLNLFRLLNVIELDSKGYQKYWNSAISTPMYS